MGEGVKMATQAKVQTRIASLGQIHIADLKSHIADLRKSRIADLKKLADCYSS
jgi:hypothetical protein